MRYVVAAGHAWGIETYWKAARWTERWDLVHTPGALAEALREAKPQYVFFLNWADRLQADVTDAFTCVNLHCTRLPFGRGGHPIENLILRGFTETVITAHQMTPDVDAGPIYGVSDPISLSGSKDEILARFPKPCAQLLRGIVETQPTPQPQVGDVVPFHRLTPGAYAAVWAERSVHV